ncbi:hypothetical protein [Crocinitomix catalasitica]|uniref:hypothetical protein n=1 Tax=Crocinitomix catalasitica TaxID=184607 RepID=UPI0012FBA798|nr:hypothetical protein [Crocinitomix catalasitica]
MKALFVIMGLLYAYSFMLPAVQFYGGPIYGYELFISPLIPFAIIPNLITILTLFRYKKFSLRKKTGHLVAVIITTCCYLPLYEGLLIGYWWWLLACFFIVFISLKESIIREYT